MKFRDILAIAFLTVKANRLRTGITVAIIAFGIMALIGIITAIESMNQSLYENFSIMGANTFSLRFKERVFRFGGGGGDLKKRSKTSLREKSSNLGKVITWEEANAFKKQYVFPAAVGISKFGNNTSQVFYRDKKTNPNVRIIGGDENYLLCSGYSIDVGRNFTSLDLESGRNVAILGSDMVKKLFDNNVQRAVGNVVRIDGVPYRVIAVLKSRGASSLLSLDNIIITSVNNVRRNYKNSNSSYSIAVNVNEFEQMDAAISEATGYFRTIRKLGLKEAENFYVDRSDSLVEVFKNLLKIVRVAAFIIGMITLFGAAVGLMNIMLVSVNERTREIGLVKAIGGTKRSIRLQFLSEAILICLFGAVIGVLLGVILGNIAGIFVFKTGFIMPWSWVAVGIFICSTVGLLAGLYPAVKAGKLDPIVALRYE
ncbi:MAG TPA: ABC transporter permease [Chitinophagaceae bacterium]|nr:ABC transporter permease [Chitinophagaceae bacterium]